ncbi:MAG: hypothetical protein HUJ25_01275 [Crocinitomicaceae bacterium]|nr:hypothetical protein [Crocinitomicaceae bacterium]
MKKGIILSLVLFGLIFMSCKKNASKFQGRVQYVDSTGAWFYADSAIITFHDKDTNAPVSLTGATDADGIFLIENVPDGQWVLKGTLMIDSNTTYIGISDKLECKGKDFVAAPIDMVEVD